MEKSLQDRIAALKAKPSWRAMRDDRMSYILSVFDAFKEHLNCSDEMAVILAAIYFMPDDAA